MVEDIYSFTLLLVINRPVLRAAAFAVVSSAVEGAVL